MVGGYLLLALIKVRVCVGRRARMLALTKTTCVYVGMGDMYKLILHCVSEGDMHSFYSECRKGRSSLNTN